MQEKDRLEKIWRYKTCPVSVLTLFPSLRSCARTNWYDFNVLPNAAKNVRLS